MRAIATSIGCGLTLLAAGQALAQAPAERPANPRPELLRFAEVLDVAVRQVSRPSPYQVLGPAAEGSCYLLPGYGAVFVLPARALPSAGGMIVVHDGRPGSTPMIGVWGREARRAPTRALKERPRPATPEPPEFLDLDREIQQIEGLVEAYSREAERASREADRALERVAEEIRVRFPEVEAVPVLPPAAPAPPAPPAASGVATPPAPAAPPAPPWRFWFQAEEEDDDARPAERVVADVRGVLIQALETRGASLTVVRPEDFLVVAVDFTTRGFPLRAQRRTERTLVVKARKKDLDERRAGRLAADELRKRIESLEY